MSNTNPTGGMPSVPTTRSSIRRKITFTTTGIATLLVITLVAYFIYDTRKTLSQENFSKLQGFADLKGTEVENYFATLRSDIASAVEDDTIRAAARDLFAAKTGLRSELQKNGAPLETFIDSIRRANREYTETNLVAYLRKLQFNGLLKTEQYMPVDDEGNLLQFIYIVSNPSPLGSKAEANTIEEIRRRGIDTRLREAFAKTTYAAVHERIDEVLQRRSGRIAADLHIAGPDGFLLYTTSKQLDFGGNLTLGADKDQGIGRAHAAAFAAPLTEHAEDRVRVTDYEPFSKALGVPSSFVACSVLGTGAEKLGTYIIEVPSDQIYKILSHNDRHRDIGLGESGENYLVASDKKARSNSRFIANDIDLPMGTHKKWYFDEDGTTLFTNTINSLTVDTKATRDVFDLKKKEGAAIYPDYRGIPVFGYYRALSTPGLNYMILSEIDYAEVYSSINNKVFAIVIISAVVLLIGVVVTIRFARALSRPIVVLDETMTKIAGGDENARAPILSNDEIGQLASTLNNMVSERNAVKNRLADENKRLQANIQDLLVVVSDASDGKLGVRAKVTEGSLGNVADALNLMLENVGELIGNAKTASNKVAAAAAEITTVAVELENGEQRQSQEITVTSDGVKDLNGQAQRVLQNCQSATQAAENARRTAEQGAKAVRELIQGMEKIRENTQANSKKIKRLGDRSMEIAGIVKVIGDISAKTDMLALNASIEAARAGEQGRGFTVVAEQVRGLADRTKTLTSQIEKLVHDIQQETSEAVAQMENQTQEVEAGTRAAQSAGTTLESIVSGSVQSSELVAQINQAATQQASRTKEMLVTVDSINRVVAEAQVHVRETRSTSEQLAGLSSELNKRLSQFEVGTLAP